MWSSSFCPPDGSRYRRPLEAAALAVRPGAWSGCPLGFARLHRRNGDTRTGLAPSRLPRHPEHRLLQGVRRNLDWSIPKCGSRMPIPSPWTEGSLSPNRGSLARLYIHSLSFQSLLPSLPLRLPSSQRSSLDDACRYCESQRRPETSTNPRRAPRHPRRLAVSSDRRRCPDPPMGSPRLC